MGARLMKNRFFNPAKTELYTLAEWLFRQVS